MFNRKPSVSRQLGCRTHQVTINFFFHVNCSNVFFQIYTYYIFRMKVAGCVAFLVAVIVVFSQSTSASPSSRLSKRSVNFTPSWGKRSGGYDIHPLVPNLSSEVQSEKCATEMYLRRLVERLQVSVLPHFHTFPIFVPILF